MTRPRLLIASTNAGKLSEFSELLSPHFSCASPLDISGGGAFPEVEEDGVTYHENALKKAVSAHRFFKLPVLSDDSGLEVVGLNDAPGVYSARYGGAAISWPERIERLLAAMEQKQVATRNARFRAVLCYYNGEAGPRFFEGVVEGVILTTPRGTNGFGYDPIFYSTELQQGLAEVSRPQKALVSHRARAVAQFVEWWTKQSKT